MRKILAALLVLATILTAMGALTSCGESGTPGPQSGGTETEPVTDCPEGGETGETETSGQALRPDVPETNRDAVLQVLHWTVDETWIPWEEICVFGYSGDTMGDAVYERTAELKEKFGISLESEYMYVSDITHKVDNMIQSGTDEYQ